MRDRRHSAHRFQREHRATGNCGRTLVALLLLLGTAACPGPEPTPAPTPPNPPPAAGHTMQGSLAAGSGSMAAAGGHSVVGQLSISQRMSSAEHRFEEAGLRP
jgi:hypothetical protein